MAPVFTSLQGLQKQLDTLPAAAPGFRRVFRGQTEDYPSMLPSGIRRGTGERWNLWQRHAMLVADFEPDLAKAMAAGQPSTLDMLTHWIHAIAQHYGGDSNYLDVTHDVQSALWFALYQMSSIEAQIVMGTGQALDPEHDFVLRQTLLKHERWTDQPGWLYVMDLPVWDGESVLEHGTLVDVAEQAPALVSNSTRMAVQRACLLHVDPDGDDLKTFYACDPVRVTWPMTGADWLKATTDLVFPPPSKDPWYAAFLSLPIGATPDVDGTIRFERPIPVAQYVPGSQEGGSDLVGRITMVQPPLALTGMIDALREGGADAAMIEHLGSSTVIMLEAALVALLPSAAGGNWNTRILTEDIPMSAPVFTFREAEPLGDADLMNVFVEFCPMERTAIESATGRKEIDYIRGLWLVRRATGEMMVAPYVQRPDSGGYTLSLIRFEPSESGFVYTVGGNPLPVELSQPLTGPLSVALFVLRCLRDGEKILPFANASIDKQSDSPRYITGVDHATAQLRRVPRALAGKTLHFVRQDNEVFMGPSNKTTKQFIAQGSGPYGAISTDDLRRFRAHAAD